VSFVKHSRADSLYLNVFYVISWSIVHTTYRLLINIVIHFAGCDLLFKRMHLRNTGCLPENDVALNVLPASGLINPLLTSSNHHASSPRPNPTQPIPTLNAFHHSTYILAIHNKRPVILHQFTYAHTIPRPRKLFFLGPKRPYS
jgi:hypothetical protein